MSNTISSYQPSAAIGLGVFAASLLPTPYLQAAYQWARYVIWHNPRLVNFLAKVANGVERAPKYKSRSMPWLFEQYHKTKWAHGRPCDGYLADFNAE